MKAVVLCLEPQDGWFVCRGSKSVSEKTKFKEKDAEGNFGYQDVSVGTFVCRLIFQHFENLCGCSLSVNNSLSFQEPHK